MIKEHPLQRQLVELFRAYHFKVFLLDAMTGVGYFRQNDPRRFAFINDLKARGYEKGQPDLCIVRNRVIFLELKTKRGRVSAEQKEMHDWLVAHGHNAFIINSIEQGVAICNNPLN